MNEYLLTDAQLGHIVELARRAERAQSDASACGTRSDRAKARHAEAALDHYLDSLPPQSHS